MKMATTSPLKDIDDNFCLCSICLEQLKEPKLMSCLHRYCKDCLASIIKGSYDVIRCPECREEIQIPPHGVDGFKTDFYSKSLVEYVQIQQSLKSDEIRECNSCSKHLKVAAYCFKCNDFLCNDCHKVHVTNKTLKDHKKHTLSMEDIETKKITIEKLASMRDAPRCYTHPEKISELYCETCGNLPVCIACTFGEHKGHNLQEVKALAKLKREMLAQKLKTLEKIEKNNELISTRQARKKLTLNVSIEKDKLIKVHDEKTNNVLTKINDIEEIREKLKQEKENTEKEIFVSLQSDMENEIQGVKKKYEEIFKVKKIEISDDFQSRESSLVKDLAKLSEKRERLDRDKNELLKSIEKQLDENVKIIETISEHFDNIKKRFETLNVMATSILASENDWSAVQCIPDMYTAATNLMKDLKKEFPELTTLTDVTVNYKQSCLGKQSFSKISEQVEMEITFGNKNSYVTGVTSIGDGNIVISGFGASFRQTSFIIVIDMNGRLLKYKEFKSGMFFFSRYCHFLSQHKVATVCRPNEIGLYDVRDGSYNPKNISDVTRSWPKDRGVTCIATDHVNNHILVGGRDSRDVYVFDDQLNYLHILTLPEMIKWPRDITVSDGHLLVCDESGGKSFVTTMNGLESKMVGEFKKPQLGVEDWIPFSICTDKNCSVYMLGQYGYNQFLVQYNNDGSQVLTTRKMYDNAYVAVAVVETSQGEKLLVATDDIQAVYVYGLLDEG